MICLMLCTDLSVVANEGEFAATGLLDGPPHGDRTPVLVEVMPLGVVVEGHLHHRVPVPPAPVAQKGVTDIV